MTTFLFSLMALAIVAGSTWSTGAEPAQSCRDVRDVELRKMCWALMKPPKGNCSTIYSPDLNNFCHALFYNSA
jgi:hypothetical protein